MLRKGMSQPEIGRREGNGIIYGRCFFIKHESYNRRHQGPCWEMRVFTTPFSNKGPHANKWRSSYVASSDNLDELVSYAFQVLVAPSHAFVRTCQVSHGNQEKLFYNDRDAVEYYDSLLVKHDATGGMDMSMFSCCNKDFCLDDFRANRPSVQMPICREQT